MPDADARGVGTKVKDSKRLFWDEWAEIQYGRAQTMDEMEQSLDGQSKKTDSGAKNMDCQTKITNLWAKILDSVRKRCQRRRIWI